MVKRTQSRKAPPATERQPTPPMPSTEAEEIAELRALIAPHVEKAKAHNMEKLKQLGIDSDEDLFGTMIREHTKNEVEQNDTVYKLQRGCRHTIMQLVKMFFSSNNAHLHLDVSDEKAVLDFFHAKDAPAAASASLYKKMHQLNRNFMTTYLNTVTIYGHAEPGFSLFNFYFESQSYEADDEMNVQVLAHALNPYYNCNCYACLHYAGPDLRNVAFLEEESTLNTSDHAPQSSQEHLSSSSSSAEHSEHAKASDARPKPSAKRGDKKKTTREALASNSADSAQTSVPDAQKHRIALSFGSSSSDHDDTRVRPDFASDARPTEKPPAKRREKKKTTREALASNSAATAQTSVPDAQKHHRIALSSDSSSSDHDDTRVRPDFASSALGKRAASQTGARDQPPAKKQNIRETKQSTSTSTAPPVPVFTFATAAPTGNHAKPRTNSGSSRPKESEIDRTGGSSSNAHKSRDPPKPPAVLTSRGQKLMKAHRKLEDATNWTAQEDQYVRSLILPKHLQEDYNCEFNCDTEAFLPRAGQIYVILDVPKAVKEKKKIFYFVKLCTDEQCREGPCRRKKVPDDELRLLLIDKDDHSNDIAHYAGMSPGDYWAAGSWCTILGKKVTGDKLAKKKKNKKN